MKVSNKFVFNILPILKIVLLLTIFSISNINCDIPVHCKREKIQGDWSFRINNQVFQPTLSNIETTCGHGFPDKIEKNIGDVDFFFPKYQKIIHIVLSEDYKVYENGKKVGKWTPVYDEGFILWYGKSVFTAFMKYYYAKEGDSKYVSNCNKTMIGWYLPDVAQNNKNWSCFFGLKTLKKELPSLFLENISRDMNGPYISNKSSIESEEQMEEMNNLNLLEKGGKTKEDKSIFSLLGNNRNIKESPELNQLSGFLQMKSKTKLKGKSKLMSKMSTEEKGMTKYEDQLELVKEINDGNHTWKAEIHDEFKGMNLIELNNHLGIKRHRKYKNSHKKHKSKKNHSHKNHSQSHKHNIHLHNSHHTSHKNYKNNKLFQKFLQLEVNPSVNSSGKENDSTLVTSQADIQRYLNTNIKDMKSQDLSKNWDWRNVGGKNFVSPMEKQGKCGSCYVFSTIESLESRLRIQTFNKDQTLFSKQFPLSCSFYTEGCKGGYPILVGKFFNEFEIVPKDCMAYDVKGVPCSQVCDYTKNKKKYTVNKYDYLGGFYSGTSESDMMKEIRARGPIPGNVVVPWTFSYYKSGIYSHKKVLDKKAGKISKVTNFDRRISWEKLDHSILLIGWGEENQVKYWIGMNTWGPNWGEKGYFRILRGENENGVESMGDYMNIKVEDR